MKPRAPHTFVIPVMGLAFTIDTPIKVARFGINSVISIIEDNLVERMRSHYYGVLGEPYIPITNSEPDYRAKRITDYLNLTDRIVKEQIIRLKNSAFGTGSEINKYFDMLPDGSEEKCRYEQLSEVNPVERLCVENSLREKIVPGRIDVNIMTKLDKNNLNEKGHVIEDGSDAVAALRGYAQSGLTNSSVILSAGMNPRLFNYMEKLSAFDADDLGNFKKQIVIKVSDYRSAFIQGRLLAKKGLWVSEFRIESGLNCGGHAFASDGYLLGPILDEFKTKKQELITCLFELYNPACRAKGKAGFEKPHEVRITVQGGIGTSEEDEFLRVFYDVDSTGWGTPFLLVPEATTVDDYTLNLLRKAKEQDVVLSKNSPLGIRFYYLKGTTAEMEKVEKIKRGIPGSPCSEKFLVSNTEFGKEPVCTASHTYQKKKIEHLESLHLEEDEHKRQLQDVLDKECLCVGLSNAALSVYHLKPLAKRKVVNICPGPNIAYFSQVVSLKKMVDHIYGRANILEGVGRPPMFLKELQLYVEYWKELLTEIPVAADVKRKAYVVGFYQNLVQGISYYRQLAGRANRHFAGLTHSVASGLDEIENEMAELFLQYQENLLRDI